MLSFKFLSSLEAQSQILQKDDYLNSLDLYNLVNFHKVETKEQYLEIAKSSIEGFTFDERKKIEEAMLKIKLRWKELNLPPLHVSFIKTNGLEMRSLAYTRGNCIYLNSGYFNFWCNLHGLLAHEIFHVLSRSNPSLKDDLYSFFGFYKVDEVKPYGTVLNPDAPVNNYAIKVYRGFTKSEVVPVITFSRLYLKPIAFKVFDKKTKETISVYKTTLPLQIGISTFYLAHPEEICADFFKLLFQKGWFYNPWKLLMFRRALKKSVLKLKNTSKANF